MRDHFPDRGEEILTESLSSRYYMRDIVLPDRGEEILSRVPRRSQASHNNEATIEELVATL